VSELIGQYAEDRWNADGSERDPVHAEANDAGPIRTQLRIVSADPGRRRLPLTYRLTDYWPVSPEELG